jgi:hypothetical protein
VQYYFSQQEFQKPGLSVQAPSVSNNVTAATVLHQIMTELSGVASEEDIVMIITTKMVLNLMQQNDC